jgi:hypothetical protein
MSTDTNFSLDRTNFLRVNSNSLTRLTVNAFLGSITFTTFVILLPTTITIQSLDMGAILLIGSETLLGLAALLFLLTVLAISTIQIRLDTIDTVTRQALVDGTTVIELNVTEKSILTKACELYMEVVPLTSWGVGGILASVLLIGFYVHIIVGAIITVTFIVVGFHLRKLWSLLNSPYSGQQTGSQLQQIVTTWVKDIKSRFARQR